MCGCRMKVLLYPLLLLWAEPAPAVAGKAVALIVSRSGIATRGVGTDKKPIRTYDRIRVGEVITAGPDGSVTVYFPADGHKEVLHAGSSIVVGARKGTAKGKVDVVESKLKVENQATLRDAISAGKIGGSVHRDNGVGVPAIAPIHEAIVVTDRPTLRWPAVKDAVGYRITLMLPDSTDTTIWTREIKGTELKCPAELNPLMRLQKYRWTVTALLANDNEKTHLNKREFVVGSENMEREALAWKKLAEGQDATDQILAAVGLEELRLFDELYPLYARITRTVKDDPRLWAIQSRYAAKTGLAQEANEAMRQAEKLGWKEEP